MTRDELSKAFYGTQGGVYQASPESEACIDALEGVVGATDWRTSLTKVLDFVDKALPFFQNDLPKVIAFLRSILGGGLV